MKNSKKAELEQYLETMTVESVGNEKKKVKNELKSYDNDFNANFQRQPNHEEKEPLRPLYVYYKKLKEALNKRGGEELSQERIEQLISNIKVERKRLREQIENYQREFEQINNRRIRFVRDIAPIENEYKKYKELKQDLQKYEEMLNR
jgi:site-specific recombinase XerD